MGKMGGIVIRRKVPYDLMDMLLCDVLETFKGHEFIVFLHA